MRKGTIVIATLVQVIWCLAVIASETELPFSDRIEILKITRYGEETRATFESKLEDISYEAIKKSVLEKIRTGYQPDCKCDFDNEFFLSLANRSMMYGNERFNPPVISVPGTWKEGGDPLVFLKFQCRIMLSQNKKYAGLIFQQYINDGLYYQHFILVNSKGEIQWEMPHEMSETMSDNTLKMIMFPDDGQARRDGHYRVSNHGKVIYIKSHMNDPEKFWILYDVTGRIIKRMGNWCAGAEFSPDGSFFLIQENNDTKAYQFDMESGTSCYNANSGELLWRKKNILPIEDAGYFVSPSGNYILACKKGLFYDLCLLNKMGQVLSTATGFEKERYSADPASMFWSPCEKLLILRKTLLNNKLKFYKNRSNIHTFPDITSGLQDNFAGLFITDVIPLTKQYLVAVGFRKSNSFGEKLENYKDCKFLAILDYQMKIQGVQFFQNDFAIDSTNRLRVDSKSKTLFWNTNDFSLQARFNLTGDLE